MEAQLTIEEKRAMLKAIRDGILEPSDIGPNKHLAVFHSEEKGYYEANGRLIEENELDAIRQEFTECNARREVVGLPLHSIHIANFEDYSQ